VPLVLGSTVALLTASATPAPPPPGPASARAAIEARLLPLIDRGALVRADGYLYAIDVGLLAKVTARTRDRTRYLHLIDLARRELVVERPAGLPAPAVAWRRQGGSSTPPDASGTTEALVLAEALFMGADAFDRPGDAALALALLDGYVAHAAIDNGRWLVRNYYNFETRTFATNSYLVDHGPDLLRQAHARRPDRKVFATVAARSLALLREAQRPNGLIDAVLQPELRTLFSFDVFSPNDVIELEQTALVAAAAAHMAPDVGRRVLDFARARIADLHATYLGRSGAPEGKRLATAGTWAALACLAAALDDRAMLDQIRAPLAAHGFTLGTDARAFDVHAAAETLLGLGCLDAIPPGRAPAPIATQ
jgi:hypothetical protein